MSKKSKKRTFNGMSYREVQRANSTNRIKLHQEDQKSLKNNRYRNIGWDDIVKLYQKIEEFLDKHRFEDFTLEELFLEADHIGNKYLTSQEVEEFNQKLSQAVNEVEVEIDNHFPDTAIEVINFSGQSNSRSRKRNNKSSY